MKRFLGGLSGRVFLAAGACAGLSAALGALLLLSLMIDQCLKRVAVLSPRMDPYLLERCERDAEELSRGFGDELEVNYYDAETLRPATSSAPPPDPELVARLAAGELVPSRMYFFAPWGGATLRRSAPRGPCSLVQFRWRVSQPERNQTVGLIFGVLALSVAGAVGLASFLAVRPITLRLQRLRRATEKLGGSAGYASAADSEADDLGQLSIYLDQAHTRIAADASKAALRTQALEQHLANVAHDLRTPIASLQLALEQLAGEKRTQDNELIRSLVDDVVYMDALIDNLYLACRLQDGADPLRGDARVELCALVDQVSRRFAALGRTRAIEVNGARPDSPVWARCNPAMAEQVLANLVHNAVSHGDPGGHAAIVLEATDDRFTITILDDGPGVPPAELPRIGERTFRSDEARQRDPHGGGLGLAIAGEVCRRADFTLSIAREEPRGLRVTVTGPRIERGDLPH